MKILILCTGNSSRSQMAEGFLKSYNPILQVFSAGTNPAPKVSSHAIKVMKEAGIDLSNNKPKDVKEFVNESFDYVITVCDHARETCPVFSGKVKNRLHFPFEDPSLKKGSEDEILQTYRQVREQINEKFQEFYVQLLQYL
ncbi:MAG: arsenate reductase ArsC [Bacteroidota bacterium]|nr:arsenate reductase ArsC [Bacteroidota bacterium]